MASLHVTVPDAGWVDRLSDLDDVELTVWDFSTPQPDRHVDLAVEGGDAGLR